MWSVFCGAHVEDVREESIPDRGDRNMIRGSTNDTGHTGDNN